MGKRLSCRDLQVPTTSQNKGRMGTMETRHSSDHTLVTNYLDKHCYCPARQAQWTQFNTDPAWLDPKQEHQLARPKGLERESYGSVSVSVSSGIDHLARWHWAQWTQWTLNGKPTLASSSLRPRRPRWSTLGNGQTEWNKSFSLSLVFHANLINFHWSLSSIYCVSLCVLLMKNKQTFEKWLD